MRATHEHLRQRLVGPSLQRAERRVDFCDGPRRARRPRHRDQSLRRYFSRNLRGRARARSERTTEAKVAITVVAGIDRPVADCSAANGYEGCILARRILRFVPGREIDIAIALRAACKAVPCDGISTCVHGECRSAKVSDSAECLEVSCTEDTLESRTPSTHALPSDGGASSLVDSGTDGGPRVDAGPECTPSQKSCKGFCVDRNDPSFGCSQNGCQPCPNLDRGNATCQSGVCALAACKSGFKNCGGVCVPIDAEHGCGDATCTPHAPRTGSHRVLPLRLIREHERFDAGFRRVVDG